MVDKKYFGACNQFGCDLLGRQFRPAHVICQPVRVPWARSIKIVE
jgi:hypothetical protein